MFDLTRQILNFAGASAQRATMDPDVNRLHEVSGGMVGLGIRPLRCVTIVILVLSLSRENPTVCYSTMDPLYHQRLTKLWFLVSEHLITLVKRNAGLFS